MKHDILISIDFVADGKCEDGCVLKMLQKSAENQLKILTRYFSSSIDQNLLFMTTNVICNQCLYSGRCDGAKDPCQGMGCGRHYNQDYKADLSCISLLLELIVANPPLFDRTNKYFGDDKFKFRIWNEICAEWYKKGIEAHWAAVWMIQREVFNMKNLISIIVLRPRLFRWSKLSLSLRRTNVVSHFKVS